MRRQRQLAAELHSPSFGAGPTLAGPRKDQASLELCKPPEHGQHKSPMCRGRVGPRISKAPKASLGLRDSVEDVEQIASGSGKPVEASDQQHIALERGRVAFDP